MVPPVAVDGSLVSIRKFKKEQAVGTADLVISERFRPRWALYLKRRIDPAER